MKIKVTERFTFNILSIGEFPYGTVIAENNSFISLYIKHLNKLINLQEWFISRQSNIIYKDEDLEINGCIFDIESEPLNLILHFNIYKDIKDSIKKLDNLTYIDLEDCYECSGHNYAINLYDYKEILDVLINRKNTFPNSILIPNGFIEVYVKDSFDLYTKEIYLEAFSFSYNSEKVFLVAIEPEPSILDLWASISKQISSIKYSISTYSFLSVIPSEGSEDRFKLYNPEDITSNRYVIVK